MNVVIIEDEKPAARKLERMLNIEGISVTKTLHSIAKAKEWFSENEQPELIFLDIQLSDGLSFEIFEKIKITSSIIFTTAYDQYALKAFKLNSIDYLLKPIDKNELQNSIKKYKHFNPTEEKQHPTIPMEQIKQLLSSYQNNYKERFTVKVGQHIRSIKIEDVECFYSENKASFIYTKTGRNYPIDYSLEQLEELLNPLVFFRVSRKYYIHIDSIKDIIAYSNSRLKIKLDKYQDDEIIVSRERVKDFKIWLG